MDESDNDTDAFGTLIKEAEILTKIRKKAYDAENSLESSCYSLDLCKREINCYKQIYKVGKIQKIQPFFLYKIIERGFETAAFGYTLHKTIDLKVEAEKFAEAAEKIGHILGDNIVNLEDPNYWKKRYQNFEICLLHDASVNINNFEYRVITERET